MASLATFSLYETMIEAAKELGVTCERIEGGLPDDGGDDASASFAGTELAMRSWCRRNEKLVSTGRVEQAEVFAGFERLSRMKGVLPRFRKIALHCEHLRLFGEDDFDPAITQAGIVALESGPLTHEWFLLIHADDYKAVLCSKDLDGFGNDRPTSERRFEGLKSNSPALVTRLREELLALVDA